MTKETSSRFGIGFICGNVFGIVIATYGWWVPKILAFVQNEQLASPTQQSSDKSQPVTRQTASDPGLHPVTHQTASDLGLHPQFDPNDLQMTSRWMGELMTQMEVEKDRNNAFAIKAAQEALDSKLATIVGNSVDWRIPVVGVNQWVVGLQAEFGEYIQDRRIYPNPHVAMVLKRTGKDVRGNDNLVFTNFGLGIDREIPKQKAMQLKGGDLVNVKGRIAKAEREWYSDRILIELAEIIVSFE